MPSGRFRKIALALPEVEEGSHFGAPDFRISGKIFATLAYEKKGFGTLLLTSEQQRGFVEDAPEFFAPVPNKWGKNGATLVNLTKVTPLVLEGALQAAWRNRAPKRLLQGRELNGVL